MTINHAGARRDLKLRRGVDLVLLIQAYDGCDPATRQPVDLTGAEIEASVKASTDGGALLEFAGAHGAEANEYSLTLTAAQTAALGQPDDYDAADPLFWDARIVWAEGRIDPAYYGYVTVYPQITGDAP